MEQVAPTSESIGTRLRAIMGDIQTRADDFYGREKVALSELVRAAETELEATRTVLKYVSRSVSNAQAPYQHMIACRKGCDRCCHQLVTVQKGEAQVIAEAVRKLDPAARDDVRKQAGKQMAILQQVQARDPNGASIDEQVGAMANAVHQNGLACPMLDTASGSCRIYKARPSPCRGAFSFELDRCERHFGRNGQPPELISEECGVIMQSDTLLPSNRKLYPMGVIPSLIDRQLL